MLDFLGSIIIEEQRFGKYGKGKWGVRRSFTDKEETTRFYSARDQIRLIQGKRHRLIGTQEYAVVAETWQHTDAVPSDEDDIIHVQDDYSRN